MEWTYGDAKIDEILEGLQVSNLTLSYDSIELESDLDFKSTKSLTLRTNDADGEFNVNDYTIVTSGDLTIDAGLINGALTINAENGSVNVIARADDAEVVVNEITTLNGAFIDADTVNFENPEADVFNTTVFNAADINITAGSADIKIDGDANDPLGSTTVNVFSAADGIAINKVNIGQLDIIAGEAGEGDLLLNGVKAVDDLTVTAATLDVNGVVTAAGIEMTADTINLDYAAVTATAGNVKMTADEINIGNSNVIANVGNLELDTDKIILTNDASDAVTSFTAKNYVNVTGDIIGIGGLEASANNMYLGGDININGKVDLRGVTNTYINKTGDALIAGRTILVNGILPAQEDVSLTLSGENYLYGDIIAGGDIHIFGNVTLQDDVAIVAGNGKRLIYLGTEAGGPVYAVGTNHDLTLRGSDVSVNGLIEVNNLTINSKADADGYSRVYFTGNTITAKNDIIISADGEVIIDNYDQVPDREILAGNKIVINGSDVTIAGGLIANNGFAITAENEANITASTLDNGVITAGTINLNAKNADGLAIGQNGDVVINAETVTVTDGTDIALSFGKDTSADIEAETLVVNNAKNLSIETNATEITVFNASGDVDVSAKEETESIAVSAANIAGNFIVFNTDGEVTFANTSIAGNLMVTADSVTIADSVVKAGSVEVTAFADVLLENAIVSADAGNVAIGAEEITVDNTKINAAGNAGRSQRRNGEFLLL